MDQVAPIALSSITPWAIHVAIVRGDGLHVSDHLCCLPIVVHNFPLTDISDLLLDERPHGPCSYWRGAGAVIIRLQDQRDEVVIRSRDAAALYRFFYRLRAAWIRACCARVVPDANSSDVFIHENI